VHDEDIRVYVAEAEQRETIVREPITVDEVKVGPGITEIDRKRLVDLINTYRDVFAKNIFELGCAKDVQMDIIESPGSVPINAKPYRTSPTDRKRIMDILRE